MSVPSLALRCEVAEKMCKTDNYVLHFGVAELKMCNGYLLYNFWVIVWRGVIYA